MESYERFRQRLDAVLRTLDVEQVRAFMIDEKQWSAEAPADPAFAMWMMIASSVALQDLHQRAYEWLSAHGHSDEAQALLKRGGAARSKSARGRQRSGPSKGVPQSKRSISDNAKRRRSPQQ